MINEQQFASVADVNRQEDTLFISGANLEFERIDNEFPITRFLMSIIRKKLGPSQGYSERIGCFIITTFPESAVAQINSIDYFPQTGQT